MKIEFTHEKISYQEFIDRIKDLPEPLEIHMNYCILYDIPEGSTLIHNITEYKKYPFGFYRISKVRSYLFGKKEITYSVFTNNIFKSVE